MIAADLVDKNISKRAGNRLYQEAVRQGALLRPLGNTIYWLPPLNINAEILSQLGEITLNSLLAFKRSATC